MNNELAKIAQNDLQKVFDVLTSGELQKFENATDAFNQDLARVLEFDKKYTNTKTVITVNEWTEPKVKKSLFGKSYKVDFKLNTDYYYLVDGEKSGMPGEVNKETLLEGVMRSFHLSYKNKNGKYVLRSLNDDGDTLRLGMPKVMPV